VLLPNQQELAQLAGTADVKAGLAAMTRVVETVAVKLGPAGGMARRGAEVYSAPALPVNAIDTTGAGDSFNAAFLYAFLNNYPLAEAIRLACAAGSLSTQAAGGTTAQPTLAQLQAALNKADHRS
jgi:sugar/nucleoside kinase (ribokinase family)